ncbi:MAG: response regulator [Chloroflexi bacterium]|nr:response regulator [Chloroflexota bacterium]
MAGALRQVSAGSREGGPDSGERVRVLVVDDDPNDLRYIRDTLTVSGYAPVVTEDPEEAVRLVEDEMPDSGAVGPDASVY